MKSEFKIWLLLLAALLSTGATGATERQTVEAILVRVNENILTAQEFGFRVRQELRQAPQKPGPDEIRQYAEMLLNAVVDEMILLERAKEKGIEIDEAAVDDAIDNLRQENDLQDPILFEKALQESGLTEERLRERYANSFLVQRAAQGEIRAADITAEELRRVYEAEKEKYAVPAKVELEQMIFPVAEDGSDAAEVARRAAAMLERVEGGSDLRAELTLAGVELQDLGAIPEIDLRVELKELLDTLEEGEFSSPEPSPGGVQVLRLVKRIPAGYRSFEEVEEEIGRRESQRVFIEGRVEFIDRLKSEYLVEVHEDRLDLALGGVELNG